MMMDDIWLQDILYLERRSALGASGDFYEIEMFYFSFPWGRGRTGLCIHI